MGNRKLKRDEDLCMATCFENYGFLSLTQNDTNYKFIKKNMEQNIWKKLETTCRTRHRGCPQIILLIMEKEQISGILFF